MVSVEVYTYVYLAVAVGRREMWKAQFSIHISVRLVPLLVRSDHGATDVFC
jgi:hypothetical protein